MWQGEIQVREWDPDMESATDTQHGHSFVNLAWGRSVLDETRDQSRADFSGSPGNRMRLLKEDGGRDQPTISRRGRGGEAKSGRLEEVCVQQRGHSAWGGASDLKPWILKRLWECVFQGAMEGPVHPRALQQWVTGAHEYRFLIILWWMVQRLLRRF